MIKLICKRCGETWYTANTKPNQKCSDCDGVLVEDTSFTDKDKKDNQDIKTSSQPKVIHLDDYFLVPGTTTKTI
jgi:transcription initiation factor IIE alpha subunit